MLFCVAFGLLGRIQRGIVREMKQIIIVVLSLLSCVGCDQATKAVAKVHLQGGEVRSFVGDTFRLQYAENKGAFLGLGASLPEGVRTLVFIFGSGAFVVGALGYLLLVPGVSPSTTLALSLVAGGGLGNLIDRIMYGGYVVDFLNVGLGSLRTGIFNVADVAIMAGGIFLVAKSVWSEKRIVV